RIVAVEERAIVADARCDEILRHLLEDRPALVAVGLQQGVAAPAVELRRELPAEIDRVLEALFEPEAAVGRMAVRGIAGDEDAADLVVLGDLHAQIPETQVFELGLEWKSGRFFQQALEIEVLPRGVSRRRGMEEEALADIDAAEELPVALQVR